MLSIHSCLKAIIIFMSFLATSAWGRPMGQILVNEYLRIKSTIAQLQPEFEVGGLLKGKSYGDYKLLWRFANVKGDHEVIRFYREKTGGSQDFEVAYHVSTEIAPGRTVIRRFLGPAATGWRADTADVSTGEHLSTQGTDTPFLDERDQQIVKEWDLKL